MSLISSEIKNYSPQVSTTDPLNDFQTFVDLVRYRAIHQGEQTAFIFLQDGETESARLTYGEIDQQARAIAAKLQSLSAFGERALLLYPAGLEFITAFLGCLYAGVIAVPLYPPKRNQKLLRLEAVVNNATAKFALTTQSVLDTVEQRFSEAENLKNLSWLVTDKRLDVSEQKWQPPQINSQYLAFLQYTSGSTGTPKGVMVSHGNLLANSADLDVGWQHTSDSKIVTWLPVFHDMGLIYGVLQPLYKGIPCYMMAPVSFLQSPVQWLKAISHYRGTHSGAPNFAYELCVQRVTNEQRETLDLSSWKMALNGAEPVKANVLGLFAQTFAPCGFDIRTFCPGYGLAEATLKVTAVRQQDKPKFYTIQIEHLENNHIVEAEIGQENVYTLVGCGGSEIDTKVIIVEPETLRECPVSRVGEIWVAGSTVAQGYWNNQQATENTFRGYLSDTGEGPFLRTGDLGFLKDGELFITGRLKDLIVIRGLNHYPQDIELTVENAHTSIRPHCSAAFAIEVEGEEKLVVVAEVERRYMTRRRQSDMEGYGGQEKRQRSDRRQNEIEPGYDPPNRQPYQAKQVLESIREAVAKKHYLQVYGIGLLKPGSIPKTSSGKIQRYACKKGYLDKTLDIVDAWELSLISSDGLTASLSSQTDDLEQSPDPSLSTVTTESEQSPDPSLSTVTTESEQLLTNWLREWISKHLGFLATEIDFNNSLLHYGLDSVMAITLVHDLKNSWGIQVDQTVAFDAVSIQDLIQDLVKKVKEVKGNSKIKLKEKNEPSSPQDVTMTGDIDKQEEADALLTNLAQMSEREVDLLLNDLLTQQKEAS